MKNTKVTVRVRFEVEYDGKVTASDIDVHDIIRDENAITAVKVNATPVKAG